MIPMVMGYDYCIDMSDVTAMIGKPALRLAATDSGIEKESLSPGLDINAVAVTS